MDKKEMINIAITAIDKNMDYEKLKYSDYMYGKEGLTEEVWVYVEEFIDQGRLWFYDRYSKYIS